MAPDAFPPAVALSLDASMRDYWLERVRQHFSDTYAGVRISKFPEDLRTYEHLLWTSQTNVVIELGAQFGGSALWFRDRLDAMVRYGSIRQPLVITIDISLTEAQEALAGVDPAHPGIVLLEGDVLDPELPRRVASHVPTGSRCLVIEDSAHTYATTFAALSGFNSFISAGGFFVVEDGCVDVDAMRASDDWPRGVLPAIRDWLATQDGQQFSIRRDLELYGLSCHPGGFLQRH